jgi:archaellum component FlaC
MIKPDPDFEKVASEFQKVQRAKNIEIGKSFGLKDPGAIIDAYEKNIEKWRKISPQVGRDVNKFVDVLNREVFSKLDVNKL